MGPSSVNFDAISNLETFQKSKIDGKRWCQRLNGVTKILNDNTYISFLIKNFELKTDRTKIQWLKIGLKHI